METELLEVMGFGWSDQKTGSFPDREAATRHAASLGYGTRRVRHPAGTDLVVVGEGRRAVVVRDANTPEQIENLIQALSYLHECASCPAAVFERVVGGSFPDEQHPRRGRGWGIFPWDRAGTAGPYAGLAERELMVLTAYHLREAFAYWAMLAGSPEPDLRDVCRHGQHSLALSRLRSALTPDKFDRLFGSLIEEREERAVRRARESYGRVGLPVPDGFPDPDAGQPTAGSDPPV